MKSPVFSIRPQPLPARSSKMRGRFSGKRGAGSQSRWKARAARPLLSRCVTCNGDPKLDVASLTKRLPLPRSVAITSSFSSSSPTPALSATAAVGLERTSLGRLLRATSAYVSLSACAAPVSSLLLGLQQLALRPSFLSRMRFLLRDAGTVPWWWARQYGDCTSLLTGNCVGAAIADGVDVLIFRPVLRLFLGPSQKGFCFLFVGVRLPVGSPRRRRRPPKWPCAEVWQLGPVKKVEPKFRNPWGSFLLLLNDNESGQSHHTFLCFHVLGLTCTCSLV